MDLPRSSLSVVIYCCFIKYHYSVTIVNFSRYYSYPCRIDHLFSASLHYCVDLDLLEQEAVRVVLCLWIYVSTYTHTHIWTHGLYCEMSRLTDNCQLTFSFSEKN